jgi:thymidylate kinase
MMGAMDAGSAPSGSDGAFHAALLALTEAGIEFSLRKAAPTPELPTEGELDIWLARAWIPAADRVLERVGFHHFTAPGQGAHRFYLSLDSGRWCKLDAKLADEGGAEAPRPGFLGHSQRYLAGVTRHGPAGTRRLGPIVAVMGPDGAGKGSLIARLQRSIPVAVTSLYLGGRRPASRIGRDSGRQGNALRDSAFVIRKAIRSWVRLAPAYLVAWRGHIVLCDRHPIEVLAIRPRRAKLARGLEAFIGRYLMPRPDAMILLDAPADVLFRRKREHSIEVLEAWRQSYAEVFLPLGAALIWTTGPREAAQAQASEVVWEALRRRRAW